MRVYLDNAATTPVSEKAQKAMIEVLTKNFGNPSSIHWHGREAKAILEDCRKIVAHKLKAATSEIFFTSCGSESNNMALKCAVLDLQVKRIVSTRAEHPSVLRTLEWLEKHHGTEITYLELTQGGQIIFEELEKQIQNDTKTLVSLMHVNNETGVILDLQKVSDLCVKHNCLFHTDTVQSMAKVEIDLEKTPISFLSASAHKFHGPKGVGFVYVNANNIVSPFINGGSQERKMRAGTENLAGIVGLATAFEETWSHKEASYSHMKAIKNQLADFVSTLVPEIKILGNGVEHTFPTVLNILFPINPLTELLVLKLDINGISVSGGSACSSGALQRSHVLEAINADENYIPVRFSFSGTTTLEEIESLCDVLKEIFTTVKKGVNA